MEPKKSTILILSGIIAGIVLVLVAQSVTLPPGTGSTAPAIPATTTTGATAPQVTGELHEFSSPGEVLPFLQAHTDPNGDYPELQPPESSLPEIPAPSSGNGTRTWSFDVDTATFRPDEYLVTATAVLYPAADTALFNVLDPQSAGPQQVSSRPPQDTSVQGSFIRIDPVGDHYRGEKFTITGTTNLPRDAEILVELYSSSFRPTQKSQSGEFSGATGTIRVSDSRPATDTQGVIGNNREHSDTNVQVRGVDEADIIKTDGNYLYIVSGATLRIVRAYPPDTAGIVATQGFSGTPLALYINGDRLTLIASAYAPDDTWNCGSGACGPSPAKQATKIFIFSVRDPSHPELVREMDIDGTYKDSRMIGSELYFLTTQTAADNSGAAGFPEIRDSMKGSSVLPVYYFDRRDRAFSMTTIGSVDTGVAGRVSAQSFLVGSAGTVYVSPDHMDIALSSYGKTGSRDSTDIYSFSIRNGAIAYEAQGTVDGTLLNQFSMDEYDGNLRVATTVQDWNRRGSTVYNEVSVLDRNMNVIGTVSDIAPTERIYAARFLGDRLYLVTYRQTDPFYVIDLSDPVSPRVLGELRIPGFSDYLHPYDDSRIIGIGKDSASGALKMALIDVTDVQHPRVIAEEKIGDSGSDSEVLRDHRAFLFDKGKNLLVLPVNLVISPMYRPDRVSPSSAPGTWGGAYVYSVDPARGFTLTGTVEHYSGGTGDSSTVKRAVYIENTLYTMSDDTIVVSDLNNRVSRIGAVSFS